MIGQWACFAYLSNFLIPGRFLHIDYIAKRLGAARAEMEYGETEGNFDIIIVNDDLDSAYRALRSFILPDIRQLMPDRPVPLVLCGPSGEPSNL